MPAKLAVPLIVWSMTFSIMGWLFLYISPTVEAALFPVLTNQRVIVDPDDRKPGEVCWKWQWVKRRHAQPVIVAWTIKVGGSAVIYQGVTRRERDRTLVGTPITASLGPGSDDFCTAIPSIIDNEPGIVVHGIINYRVPHGLWTVWQDLPPVRVPELPR